MMGGDRAGPSSLWADRWGPAAPPWRPAQEVPLGPPPAPGAGPGILHRPLPFLSRRGRGAALCRGLRTGPQRLQDLAEAAAAKEAENQSATDLR